MTTTRAPAGWSPRARGGAGRAEGEAARPAPDPRYRADGSPILPCAEQPLLFDSGDPTAAKALCRSCPQLRPCALLALGTDMAGVAGGMTQVERAVWRQAHGVRVRTVEVERTDRQIVADRPRGIRSPAVAEVIARRAGQGQDDRQIGDAIGLSVEGVARYRRQFGIDPGYTA